MLSRIYIDSSDPIKVINMGLLLFFIQNLIILLVDLMIAFVPELGAILFFASLWIDIIAGVVLIFGFRAYSKINSMETKPTKRISNMLLIWVPITLIVRVATNMNFNIKFITDTNILLILFTILVITSLYFSSIVYNMIKFFSNLEKTNLLIPKLYVGINIVSLLLIGLGLISTQTIFSIIVAEQQVDNYPIEFIFGIMILGLGAVSKVTIVPLLGLITFHNFRNIWDIKLSSISTNRNKKLSKVTYRPKKLEF